MEDLVVVGGFERSGHDAAAEALYEAAIAAGRHCRVMTWRDELDLNDLLLFHLHREGARLDLPGLIAFGESPQLQKALVEDLARHLSPSLNGVKTVLSAHPWSTMVLSRIAENISIEVVDVHVEFSAWPVVTSDRVTWHTGAGAPRVAKPSVNAKFRALGVPIRQAFMPGLKEPRALAVNCGSNGWFLRQAAAALPAIIEATGADRVSMLIGEGSSVPSDSLGSVPAEVEWVQGKTDISGILRESPFLVTKAGGAPVAEALGCGVMPILLPSGVPWEDDAFNRLIAAGVALDGTSPHLLADIRSRRWRSEAVHRLAEECRAAASSIIALAISEDCPTLDESVRSKLGSLVARAEREAKRGPLSQASKALLDALTGESG